jgi:hypothetical protein
MFGWYAPRVPDEQPGARGAGARRGSKRVLFGVLAVYAALAVVAYLPTLPLNGSHTQICTCGDTAQEVWFLAWVRFSLTHGHSLFYSNWVLYPSGVNLMDNTAMTLLGLIVTPVTVLAGPVAAYNLVLRAGFTLSALAMFVVMRRVVRWWPAAFAAGLLYGFSPFMVGQGLSHEFLVFAPIPPLVLGILLDVLGPARMRAHRAGLLLGVLFAAQLLIASETFVMMVLFSVVGVALALCYRGARARIGHLLRTAAWGVGACAALAAYPVYFFLTGPQHVVGSPHPLRQLRLWHGDLLGALLPTSLMRFAPPLLERIGAHLVHGNLQENGTYLGLPLVLITIGLGIACRRRPVTVVASVLAVLSYALSLGSPIYIANHDTGVPGPFALLARVPVLQDVETARFSLFTVLFVAVVLGTGLDRLRYPVASAAATAVPAGRVAGPPVPAAAGRLAGAPLAASGSAADAPRPPPAGPPAAGGQGAATPVPARAAPVPAGGFSGWARTGRGRVVIAAAVAVVALLPLVPRWPYPVGQAVTPGFFTTSAVQRIPSGSVVVTYPFPVGYRNRPLVWQAEASMRFRMLGGSPFFVPGPGRSAVEEFKPLLYPRGIDAVFTAAFRGTMTRRGTPPPLRRTLLQGIRADIRRYHISAVLIYPLLGRDPALAIRYMIVATRHHPELVRGVLGWFHLDR